MAAVRRLVLPALATLLAAAATAAPAPAATHAPRASHAPKPNPNTGMVDIFTTLGYQNSEAAGTGIIVGPSGEVVTNNHVIRGATSIRVVDVTTHRTYSATVIGYSVTADVAVLQLTGIPSVKPVRLGNSSNLRVGQRVVARGNAGGAGGAPKVSVGTITGLHRRIVARDDQGNAETLTNLIETDASVEPGDSGGPLLNTKGRVIGIVTAGSSSFRFQGGGGLGYAIPINKVRGIVRQIELGNQYPPAIHVGPTAFLGVGIQDVPDGVQIVQVIGGSAAEAAGLATGDVLTSLNGTPVSSTDDLQRVVLGLTPGETVPIEWTDATGAAHSGQITPADGPPQ